MLRETCVKNNTLVATLTCVLTVAKVKKYITSLPCINNAHDEMSRYICQFAKQPVGGFFLHKQ